MRYRYPPPSALLRLRDAESFRRLHLLMAEHLVEAAVHALLAGHDSPGLRILAGDVSGDLVSLEAQFATVLRELGIAPPSQEEAVWTVARHHMARIAGGEIEPFEGFEHVMDDVLGDHVVDAKLVGDGLGVERLVGTYWELRDRVETPVGVSADDTLDGLATDAERAAMRRHATAWIDRHGGLDDPDPDPDPVP